MVQRGQSTTPEDDANESYNSSSLPPSSRMNGVKVKAEKVKMEKAKKEKQRESRRARVDDEDEDEHEENGEEEEDELANGAGPEIEEEEDEAEDASPRSRKRARVDEEGGSREFKGEPSQRTRPKTLPRGEDGYVPGSIVRIQLRNFVTYDWVEFRPGPYLNMILGPNGTGKSSIACAIALGLNFPPSILGRAADLPSFVKLGTPGKEGHIEIELKGAPRQKNQIIRRTIRSDSKASKYTLNGHQATGKEIDSKIAELNVQVGNLCSFLPQDKVSEFAQMSSQQLLKETQKAAGDENLTAWHQTLIESGKEFRKVQEQLDGEREQLKQQQERNEGLEREVERFHQRRQIEERIQELEFLIPLVEFEEFADRYKESKIKQRAMHERVKQLRDKNKPAHDLLKKYADQHVLLTEQRDAAKKKCAATFKGMKTKWSQNDALGDEAESLTTALDELKNLEKKRLQAIKTLDNQIARMQHEKDNPPQTEDIDGIIEEMRALNADRGPIKTRHETLKQNMRDNIYASERENTALSACNKDLRALDDAGQRKLEELKKWDPVAYEGVVWLRKNQHQFEKEIIEPPCLCLDVKDRRFADAVEACFGFNQMKMFVAQTPNDYNKLNHLMNDSGTVLRPGGRVNTWFREPMAIPGPPLNREEMHTLGFNGYAMEYVDCPEGLKWFLQRDVQLHRVAIALDGRNFPTDRATELVSRMGPNGQGGSASFVAGSTMNQVMRSRYGQRNAQNTTKEIKKARNLVQAPVDHEAKKRIDERIQQIRTNLGAIEAQAGELGVEENEIKTLDADYNTRMGALKARHKVVKDVLSRIQYLATKIEEAEKKLERVQNEPSMEEKSKKLKADIVKNSKNRLKVARTYTGLMRSLIGDQAQATRLALEVLQIGANKVALDALCKVKDTEYDKAMVEFHDADVIYQDLKAQSKVAVTKSKAIIRTATPEQQERYSAMQAAGTLTERSSDKLKEDVETEKNNLEMNRGANIGVIQQYEKRKEEIARLIAQIETREKNAQRMERSIKTARDNWEPALERLVASIGKKFSAAFDRIGCAGEIRISRHEDFDKWAIDILVKFRDKERLQLLTGQRQSGGERSLTTILYLMSLTEEARSPFSLVDEINQGMDMRAERAVHNSLVETTCKADSSQYFLITPKLLPDLNYHERMKVLCVNNGEWLPEERDLGNMMNMIESYVRHK